MEDLELKEIWKSGQSDEEFNYSAKTIERIIKQGPSNIVAKFVKTMIWEKWINLVVLTLCTAFLGYEGYWLIGGIIMLVNVAFFIYYTALVKKLDREYIDSNVIQYLHDVQRIISTFIRHYQIAGLVLMVPAYFAAVYLHSHDYYDFHMEMPEFLAFNFIVLLVALGLTFWIIDLLYGRKARKLKKMIASLKDGN